MMMTKKFMITGAAIFMAGTIIVPAVIACSAQGTKQFGKFTLTRETDPITDADISSIVTTRKDSHVALGWFCTGKDVMVVMTWDRLLFSNGDDDLIDVQYRFDAQPPIKRRWTMTGRVGNGASYYSPKAFTAAALKAKRVALQFVDHDSNVVTETFELDGFATAYSKLACGTPISILQQLYP
jgi:hypothetical protein